MATQVLIIHRQLAFAVSIKHALDRTGQFEVHPFTNADAALDYLRGHKQDVALADLDMGRADVVALLRAVQPNLPIIAMPQQDEDVVSGLNLSGSINAPFAARDVIPLLQTAAGKDDEAEQSPTGLLGRIKQTPGQTRQGLGQPEFSQQDYVQTRPLSEIEKEQANFNPLAAFDPDEVYTPIFAFENLPPSPSAPSEPITITDADFNDILTGIGSEFEDAEARPDDDFSNLVNSMRGETAEPQPLPARHQQFVEFILTGGMDNLLDEIERKKTDELRAPEGLFDDEEDTPVPPLPSVSDAIAADEPPMPSFEDNGTVGDLITGVQDPGFQNVLSILRGEAPAETFVEDDFPDLPTASDGSVPFGVVRPESIDDILNSLQPPPSAPAFNFDFGDDLFADVEEDTPAKRILSTATDETHPIDEFSISELLASIDQQQPTGGMRVEPLPSWIVEPGMPDEFPELPGEPSEPSDLYALDPTLPNAAAEYTLAHQAVDDVDEIDEVDGVAEADVEQVADFDWAEDNWDRGWDQTTIGNQPATPLDANAETSTLRVGGAEPPPPNAPATQPVSTDWLWEIETPDQPPEPPPAPPKTLPEPPPRPEAAPAPVQQIPIEPDDWDADLRAGDPEVTSDSTPVLATGAIDDPYIAQLAVSLTESSLEMTAEAVLLTRDRQIVAFSGRMTRDELAELRAILNDDWDAKADEARMRFVDLPGTNKDLMVYSRLTVDNLTLTLIFAHTTPLKDIRRQGRRLLDALQAVPEAPVEFIAPAPEQNGSSDSDLAVEPPDDGTRTTYAYVWTMRDPNGTLPRNVAQAIVSGMSVQLREQSWFIRELRATDDYVYLYGDSPADQPPPTAIRDLKRRSAHIAHMQNTAFDPGTLWSEGYLVVAPGRHLEPEEIQQFVQFARM